MGYMRRWRYLTAALIAAVLTSGCQSRQYERIEIGSAVTEEAGRNAEAGGERETARATRENVITAEEIPEEKSITLQDGIAIPNVAEGQPEKASGDVKLLFGGDVLLSSHVLEAYDKGGGIAGVLDDGYRSVIRDADFFMVNEEFPFSSRGAQAADKQFTFRLPPDKVKIFQEMGIDAVTLANNHALDFGQDALLDSCAVLDDSGILHTGAGSNLETAKKPVEAELGGKRIAIVGATRVIPESGWAAGKNHAGMLSAYDVNHAVLFDEVRKLKENHDIVIAYIHWGVERDEKPQEYQRKLGKQLIDAGADMVIGAHPHVLQGIEYYEGKPIVYSLGNFVFGSSIPRTALLEITINSGMGNDSGMTEGSGISLRLIPGRSGAGYTRMLEESGRPEFFRYMEGISFGITYGEDGTVSHTGSPE